MKKNVKAIIAALSASIMCAVPVAASFASTAATTSITASALYENDLVKSASLLPTTQGNIVITEGAITYRLTGPNTAELYGRLNQVSQVEMADVINYNDHYYKVTYVRPEAFLNAHRTATGSGVTYFRCGKYVKEIGNRAFKNSSLMDLDLHDADDLEIIGNEAFAGASLNPTLYIPSKVKRINAGAFRDNTRVKYVTIDGGYNLSTGQWYNDIQIWFGSNAFAGTTSLRSFTMYRNDPRNANGGTAPDPEMLKGSRLTINGVSGDVNGVPKFKQIFFPHN